MFKKKNISNLFYLFLIAHLFVWTLIPSITNNNLPLDTIEALAWGSNLDWGYNKHPPVSAFFVEFFYFFFGKTRCARSGCRAGTRFKFPVGTFPFPVCLLGSIFSPFSPWEACESKSIQVKPSETK